MIGGWRGEDLKGHIAEVYRCVERSGHEVESRLRDRLVIRWAEGENSFWLGALR